MEKIIKKVLNQIEKNGFEAYIIGGFVRDYLIGKISYDVDICTNALPKDLVKLFPNGNVGIYGAIDFKIGKYSFEITTYRKEYDYNNRHPNKVEYINNLLEDIQRRDFKINTLCMNQKGNIIDVLGATDDINNKMISTIGDAKKKIVEDPLRILRAIRLATNLDFELDKALITSIENEIDVISTLSDARVIDELSKILISDNYNKGINLLDDLHILEKLNIKHSNIIKTSDLNGMWAQFEFQKPLAFSKETIHNIDTIKEIVSSKKIDQKTIFDYGLYNSLVAAEILQIDKKQIHSLYKKLPIKTSKDIALSNERIISILELKQNDQIKHYLKMLTDELLYGRVKNNPRSIYKYLQSVKEAKNE